VQGRAAHSLNVAPPGMPSRVRSDWSVDFVSVRDVGHALVLDELPGEISQDRPGIELWIVDLESGDYARELLTLSDSSDGLHVDPAAFPIPLERGKYHPWWSSPSYHRLPGRSPTPQSSASTFDQPPSTVDSGAVGRCRVGVHVEESGDPFHVGPGSMGTAPNKWCDAMPLRPLTRPTRTASTTGC
jgi:hypothetical protein